MFRRLIQSGARSSSAIQWLLSLVLSALIVTGVFFLILAVADWKYIQLHPVAAYEEDLGYGLVMVSVAMTSAAVALPVAGLLAWHFKKVIARKANERKHT